MSTYPKNYPIFTEEEKNSAIKYKKILNENKIFDSPIVTKITKLGEFYKAEDYHQNYYNNNPNQPYCKFVIKPKLDKYFMNNNY